MSSGQKPKTYPAQIVERVRVLYGANHTQTEIAARLGMTQKIVWNLMRRHAITARVASKRDQHGTNNASWKGDKAGRQAFHRRLYAKYGKPKKCAVCNTETAKAFDYANLSGRYEDLDDYAPMCRSCHAIYDNKIENISNRRDADAQA